jgi:hypothetical protein
VLAADDAMLNRCTDAVPAVAAASMDPSAVAPAVPAARNAAGISPAAAVSDSPA